jgi:hypothetical protein
MQVLLPACMTCVERRVAGGDSQTYAHQLMRVRFCACVCTLGGHEQYRRRAVKILLDACKHTDYGKWKYNFQSKFKLPGAHFIVLITNALATFVYHSYVNGTNSESDLRTQCAHALIDALGVCEQTCTTLAWLLQATRQMRAAEPLHTLIVQVFVRVLQDRRQSKQI